MAKEARPRDTRRYTLEPSLHALGTLLREDFTAADDEKKGEMYTTINLLVICRKKIWYRLVLVASCIPHCLRQLTAFYGFWLSIAIFLPTGKILLRQAICSFCFPRKKNIRDSQTIFSLVIRIVTFSQSI